MSPSTIDRIATLAGALIVSSCRFGGPSGDPTLHVVDAAGGFAGTGGQAGRTGSGGSSGDGDAGAAGNSGGSAGATADASNDVADDVIAEGGRDGDAEWPDIQADADVASDANRADSTPPTVCVPPFTSAGCDPVCNIGCPALFRCDVTDTARTGVCIGTLLSSIGEGMACMRTPLTDDCFERLSCVEGICRRLCYRDTDCATSGSCCTTAIEVDAGPSGYRICGPCTP
jgi:hypothetical protein